MNMIVKFVNTNINSKTKINPTTATSALLVTKNPDGDILRKSYHRSAGGKLAVSLKAF